MTNNPNDEQRPSNEAGACTPPLLPTEKFAEDVEDCKERSAPKELAWMLGDTAASVAIAVALQRSSSTDTAGSGYWMLGAFSAALLIINGTRRMVSNHVKLKFSSTPVIQLFCGTWVGILVYFLHGMAVETSHGVVIWPFIIMVAMVMVTALLALSYGVVCKTLRREVRDITAYNERVRLATPSAAANDSDTAAGPPLTTDGAREVRQSKHTVPHKYFSAGEGAARDE